MAQPGARPHSPPVAPATSSAIRPTSRRPPRPISAARRPARRGLRRKGTARRPTEPAPGTPTRPRPLRFPPGFPLGRPAPGRPGSSFPARGGPAPGGRARRGGRCPRPPRTTAGPGARSGATTDDRTYTSGYDSADGRDRPDERRGGRRALLSFRLPGRCGPGWRGQRARPSIAVLRGRHQALGGARGDPDGVDGRRRRRDRRDGGGPWCRRAGPRPCRRPSPATAASNDFTATPADQARGISQSLAQVASSGSTVVAAGAEAGARIGRAQSFLSSDAGKTWETRHRAGGRRRGPGSRASGHADRRRSGPVGGPGSQCRLDQPRRPDLDTRLHPGHRAHARRRSGERAAPDGYRVSRRRCRTCRPATRRRPAPSSGRRSTA